MPALLAVLHDAIVPALLAAAYNLGDLPLRQLVNTRNRLRYRFHDFAKRNLIRFGCTHSSHSLNKLWPLLLEQLLTYETGSIMRALHAILHDAILPALLAAADNLGDLRLCQLVNTCNRLRYRFHDFAKRNLIRFGCIHSSCSLNYIGLEN